MSSVDRSTTHGRARSTRSCRNVVANAMPAPTMHDRRRGSVSISTRVPSSVVAAVSKVLRSGSRWSVWFCAACKERAIAFNNRAVVALVPIGRHSMMHRTGLQTTPAPSDNAIGAFVAQFGHLVDRMRRLDAWAHEVVRRNFVDMGFDKEPDDHVVALPRRRVATSTARDDSTRCSNGRSSAMLVGYHGRVTDPFGFSPRSCNSTHGAGGIGADGSRWIRS